MYVGFHLTLLTRLLYITFFTSQATTSRTPMLCTAFLILNNPDSLFPPALFKVTKP